MNGLLSLMFVVVLQVQPGVAIPLEPAPHPQTTTTITTVAPAASDAEIAHAATVAAPAGMNGGATAVELGLNKLATQSLQLPNYLLTRDKNVILNKPEVKTLNDSLRFVGLAVWFICLALIIAKHLAGPLAGCDIMDLSVALPVGIFMGLLGWFNQPLLSILIDLAGAVISSVVNSSLSSAITPGLSFNTASQVIIGPILGVIYDLMSIWLIFKLWLQIGWLWILTAAAPIYITSTGAPLLGKYGSHWWQNWFGTLIDPILTVVGLHLVVPWFDLLQGAPDLATELGKALTFFVLLSTVGWHRGAYRPQGVDALIAVGLWRMFRGMQGRTTPGPSTPALPPAQSVPWPPAISGQNNGTGGGTSASWWKTGRWAVAGA